MWGGKIIFLGAAGGIGKILNLVPLKIGSEYSSSVCSISKESSTEKLLDDCALLAWNESIILPWNIG